MYNLFHPFAAVEIMEFHQVFDNGGKLILAKVRSSSSHRVYRKSRMFSCTEMVPKTLVHRFGVQRNQGHKQWCLSCDLGIPGRVLSWLWKIGFNAVQELKFREPDCSIFIRPQRNAAASTIYYASLSIMGLPSAERKTKFFVSSCEFLDGSAWVGNPEAASRAASLLADPLHRSGLLPIASLQIFHASAGYSFTGHRLKSSVMGKNSLINSCTLRFRQLVVHHGCPLARYPYSC